MLYKLALGCCLFFSTTAFSQSLNFDDITEPKLEDIVGDLSANFTHTAVEGASALGRIFGVEVGIAGGMTKTPHVEELVTAQDPTADAGAVPHAGIIAMLTVPFGLTVEANFVPETGGDEFKFQTTGVALKWTMTDTILSGLPLSLALRGHLKKTEMSFEQTIDNDTFKTDVKFEDTVTGLDLVVSRSLIFLEPYASLGLVNADGTISFTGSPNTIFDPSLTTGTSATAKKSTTSMALGSTFTLLFFKLGLEYAKLFDTDRYSAKLAFSF